MCPWHKGLCLTGENGPSERIIHKTLYKIDMVLHRFTSGTCRYRVDGVCRGGTDPQAAYGLVLLTRRMWVVEAILA